MKLIATLISGLFAVTAFAAEPAKKEEKKSKNPFINMANTAKKNNNPFNNNKQTKGPKPNTKGFGGASVVRRSGRGG